MPQPNDNSTLTTSETKVPTAPMLDAALAYAGKGFHFYPLHRITPEGHCSCEDGAECRKPGKHGITDSALSMTGGIKGASNDLDLTRRRWEAYPEANIGLRTGQVSGITVIDIDGEEGRATWERLREEHGDPEVLPPYAITGGGGWHFFMRYRPGLKSHVGVLPGIDIRNDNATVVLPPSGHLSGARYYWGGESCSILDHEPAPWPDWLAAAIHKPRTKAAASLNRGRFRIPEGRRNSELTSVAGVLRRRGLGFDAMLPMLLACNAAACDPPLDEGEVEQIARSVSNYASGIPARRDLPPFPLDVFPDNIRNFVTIAAEASNVPPEFVGAPLLAYAGAVAGNTRTLRLKADWEEHAGIWLAVVAGTGSGKTPALKKAAHPVRQLQAGAIETYKREYADWLRKKKDKDVDEGEEPKAQHYLTTDTTPEALAEMLSESAGLVIDRDEIVGWVRSFNQYRNKGGDERQKFLSIWSNVSMKIDRKKSSPIYVRNPVTSAVGGIQPDLLPELAEEAGRRDGFIERFLFIYPETGPMRWNSAALTTAQIDPVAALFRKLRRRPPVVAKGHEVYSLSDEAAQAWAEWYDATMTKVQVASGIERGILAKAPNQLARLTLALHLLTDLESELVRQETLAGAVKLYDYFYAHTRHVVGVIDPRRKEERLLAVLQDADEWMSMTTIANATNRNIKSRDLRRMLEDFQEEGLAEYREVPTGARPRQEWRHAGPLRRNEENEELPTDETPDPYDENEEMPPDDPTISSDGHEEYEELPEEALMEE